MNYYFLLYKDKTKSNTWIDFMVKADSLENAELLCSIKNDITLDDVKLRHVMTPEEYAQFCNERFD